jgi:hypothetical protein
MSFGSLIERLCGVHLPFVDAPSLKEAQRKAQSHAKFLLVYLHCADHPDALPFVTDVLAGLPMTSLFRESVMLYGAAVHDAYGSDLAQELQCTTFPYAALCVKSEVIFDIQGRTDAADFEKELRVSMDEWYPVLAKEISARHERESARRMREREEQEMLEAIRIDTERLAQFERQEAENKASRAAREQAAKEEEARQRAAAALEEQNRLEAERQAAIQRAEEQRARDELELKKAVALSALPEEPPASLDPSLVATIAVRTFTGKSFERRFARDSPVQHLYLFASSTEAYDGRPFHLAAGFPPRRLDCAEETPIGQVQALVPRSVVVMRDGL